MRPDRQFAHEPEPIPAHLTDVAPWCSRPKRRSGSSSIPDADRLALIDETGHVRQRGSDAGPGRKYRLRQERGPVVINMSTSRMVEDIARALGCECHRAAVGEANVVGRMRETQGRHRRRRATAA